MKKIILMPTFLVLLSSITIADYRDMMGYGMMGGGWAGMGLLGAIYFAFAALIFSIIFWLTHNWLVKGKKR
jgi:uncharacterized membrane protein